MSSLRAMIVLVRPKHWVKNVLVFFPVVFGGALFEGSDLTLRISAAFLAFCFASSAVYVINDLRDVEKDRAHPSKRFRPLAAGGVGKGQALALIAVLCFCAIGLNAVCGGLIWSSWVCLVGYVLLNVFYSMGLKRVPIVDIAILASGYFLRVLYGSVVTGIEISAWLYLTVIALSFYLGLGKRRNEHARLSGQGTREVLEKYPADFLSSNMTVFFALGLTFYSLWATDSSTVARTSEGITWTIPLVFLICLRYSFLVSSDSSGDPIEVVAQDKALLALIAGFVIMVFVIVYGGTL